MFDDTMTFMWAEGQLSLTWLRAAIVTTERR